MVTFKRVYPKIIPIIGARTMKIKVFDQPLAIIAPNPALAIAAPAYPPIKAWEELVGSPQYQVKMFQITVPASPAKTTVGVMMLMSIMPFPRVFATAVPKMKSATKLKKAAHTTACLGVKTRVETTVAMEFAAS